MRLTSISIPGNSKCLVSSSTPRIVHEDLPSESGTMSRKQSFVSNVQNHQECDENSNVIADNTLNNNEVLFEHGEQHESTDNFDSFIFDASGDRLNPEIEEVVNKIHDWIKNEDKHKLYQEEDENDKEDFFRWISDEERNKITEDILKCFEIEGGGGYEILTDIEVEQRYFAKNFDAIPLHLLLVHSTGDLLESLEKVKKVPSAGEELYTIEDERFDTKFNFDVNNIETFPGLESLRSPSYDSESSFDLTQSSYANSSFGYQTECDFDELVNGVSGIAINYEEEPTTEDFQCEDGELSVEFLESFFDKS